jgi:hypothetical protein
VTTDVGTITGLTQPVGTTIVAGRLIIFVLGKGETKYVGIEEGTFLLLTITTVGLLVNLMNCDVGKLRVLDVIGI